MPTQVQVPPFTAIEIEERLTESPAPDNLHCFYLLLCRTDIRAGEALGLHWGDLDLEIGSLAIRRTCNRKRIGTPKNDLQGSLNN